MKAPTTTHDKLFCAWLTLAILCLTLLLLSTDGCLFTQHPKNCVVGGQCQHPAQ